MSLSKLGFMFSRARRIWSSLDGRFNVVFLFSFLRLLFPWTLFFDPRRKKPSLLFSLSWTCVRSGKLWRRSLSPVFLRVCRSHWNLCERYTFWGECKLFQFLKRFCPWMCKRFLSGGHKCEFMIHRVCHFVQWRQGTFYTPFWG